MVACSSCNRLRNASARHGTNHLLIYHGHCSRSHFTWIKQPPANKYWSPMATFLDRFHQKVGGVDTLNEAHLRDQAWWNHWAQKSWLLWHCCWRLGVYHDRPPSVHACVVYIGQIKSKFKMSNTIVAEATDCRPDSQAGSLASEATDCRCMIVSCNLESRLFLTRSKELGGLRQGQKGVWVTS